MKTSVAIMALAVLMSSFALAMERKVELIRKLRMAVACPQRIQELKKLLMCVSDMHMINEEGDSLLHLAAKRDNPEAIDVLIDAGFLPDVPGCEGRTPLHTAAWFGSAQALVRLMARGARTDNTEYLGNTPLHWAAWRGQAVIAKLLLDAEEPGRCGLPVNNERRTALHLAAAGGYSDVVELLWPRARGSVMQRDVQDQTAAEVASQLGHGHVVQLIESLATS